MNYLQRYNEWENISEATLDSSKDLIDYNISRTGWEKIELLGVSKDIKLTPVSSLPDDKEFVIQIRNSSFKFFPRKPLPPVIKIFFIFKLIFPIGKF